MNIFPYDRSVALDYCKRWAFDRNPKYFDFEKLGGDCTNFISQCLFAGCGVMNQTPITGWFYYSLSSRAPAWTGVNEFYNFIVNNKGIGPVGELSFYGAVSVGDVIQLGNTNTFYHGVIVTKIVDGEIFTASHTRDTYDKKLSDYRYERLRYIKIKGYRK